MRKPTYEEVLSAAVKDQSSQHGLLSVGMQRFATNAINNPLFQRVQATVTTQLETQQRQVLEQREFQNNLQKISVDARVSHEDLKWLVENLQQPPPPPPMPPPPPSDARLDAERVAAEVDGLLQKRAVAESHEKLAAEVQRQLAAQAVATPAQQIIREHHHHYMTQPPPVPVPPMPTSITHEVRHTGHSVHEIFLRQLPRPPDEIPITYFAGGGGPPPAPGGGREMVRSYGPAKLPKERMTPFQGGGPPPSTGGATAPMPVATPVPVQQRGPRFDRSTVPIRREYFPPRRVPDPTPVAPPDEPQRRPKRKAPQQAVPVNLKPYRVPRGPGHKLGDGEPAFVPFSGRAQKLPDEVVDNARQRMMDIARRHQQESARKQDFTKLVENEKRQRRGGGRGDVVALGKRKEPEPETRSMLRKAAPQGGTRSRQRLYGPGTQLFDIGG